MKQKATTEEDWISVNDRLPTHTARYLIAARGDVTEAAFHMEANAWEACNSRKRVTAEYWMPLPKYPKSRRAFDEWWTTLPRTENGSPYVTTAEGPAWIISEALALAVWDSIMERESK